MILDLPIKKKWFDLIKSGEKLEEYREIKPHWNSRIQGKDITHVRFRNGYGKNAPSFVRKVLSIGQGAGQSRWGAIEGEEYWVISLKAEQAMSSENGVPAESGVKFRTERTKAITMTKEYTITCVQNHCSIFCRYFSSMYYKSCSLFNADLVGDLDNAISRCPQCVKEFGE